MKSVFVGLLVVLSVAGPSLQQDGGCSSTGMGPYDYSQALCMSGLFYEAQRSGYLPSDNRISWRGDSATSDGSDNGVDLEGGYYDAGDHVKFGFPMAYSITALAWGLIAYADGYSKAGQTSYGRKTVKWGADYLLKAHTSSSELWGQVGDGDLDHAYWGRPEDMTMERPSDKIDSSNPGSDLAAETAAALAATSIVYKGVDDSYSSQCLSAARELFDLADQHRGLYQDSIPAASAFYSSYSYEDELAWGALWMYKATNEESYLTKAKEFIDEFGILYYAQTMDWDAKQPGIYALAAELDGSQVYKDALKGYADHILYEQQHTPGGLVYMGQWGSLREAQNCAFIVMRAASLGIDSSTYQSWVQQQADYALGSYGRSYVVGFGTNPPERPHHRAASCPDPPTTCDYTYQSSPDPNPHVLYGALVGGPDENDYYVDDREDYVKNEVACDYNALFSGVLAAMVENH